MKTKTTVCLQEQKNVQRNGLAWHGDGQPRPLAWSLDSSFNNLERRGSSGRNVTDPLEVGGMLSDVSLGDFLSVEPMVSTIQSFPACSLPASL